MSDRIISFIVVIVLAVFIGQKFVEDQRERSKFDTISAQQTQMLKIQDEIAGKLVSGGSDMNLAGVLLKLQDLEQRVAQIEGLLGGVGDDLGFGGAFGEDKGSPSQFPPQPPAEDFSKVYDIPVEHTVVRGDPDAPVTIVAFDDFQCPFCSRFHPPVLDILKEYPGKVNFMIKHFPLSFHAQSMPSAKAVLAAGKQGKYHEMADALLLNNYDLSEERFKQEAEKLGLDVEKFMKDYRENNDLWEQQIQADTDLGNAVDVRGTPTFYINGRKTDARDTASLKQEIEKILNSK